MKSSLSQVVFWNTWGHRHPDELHVFLERHAHDTDVFCLTEVTDIDKEQLARLGTHLHHGNRSDEKASHVNGYAQLSERFIDSHDFFYESATRAPWTCNKTGTVFDGVGFGSAMIYKKELIVIATGNDMLNFSDKNLHPRILQWIVYQKNGVQYLVAHLHGVWIKDNTKGDHAVRTEQSIAVRKQLSKLVHLYKVEKVVFGGDFNLDMDTSALRLLEQGTNVMEPKYRNLITEWGITNTRTAGYRNFGASGESMYADYVLVSPNVEVHSFAAHTDVLASDHAPLIISFS